MRVSSLSIIGASLLALAACRDEPLAPSSAARMTAAGDAVGPAAEPARTATVRWQRLSVTIFRARFAQGGPPPDFGRINAYLSLAQYRAVRAAVEASRGSGDVRPTLAGAAAGASVVVLKQFHAAFGAAIDAEFEAQRASYGSWPGRHGDFDAGDDIGRSVGADVLAQAATDGLNSVSLPPAPSGPGFWVSSGAPTVRGLYGVRPFVLESVDEIDAPAPPAFGSQAFVAALDEVRSLTSGRTPEELDIVRKWVPFSAVPFTEYAADLVDGHQLKELEAARVFAYANVAAFDAIIGCFQTKFTYWFIRPSQADPAVSLGTGLPNHPSYPSAHSCQSGGWEGILADAFPADRGAIHALAQEASFSRIVGGLHYRFDGDEGLALGNRAAALALERGVQ